MKLLIAAFIFAMSMSVHSASIVMGSREATLKARALTELFPSIDEAVEELNRVCGLGKWEASDEVDRMTSEAKPGYREAYYYEFDGKYYFHYKCTEENNGNERTVGSIQ